MSVLKRLTVAAILLAGFVIPTPLPAAAFRRGDANADALVNITDAIATLGFLFLGQPKTLACTDAADADDGGTVNITDAVYVLGFLFLGGPEPPAPFATCGPDPTVDALDCAAFPPCPQELQPPALDPLPSPAQVGGTIVLTGRAAAGVTVEVAGGARMATGTADGAGRFAVEVALFANRLNRLFAAAVDGGRRSAPSSAEVIHDAERPFVSIDEPRDGERSIGEAAVVTGRVSDRLTGALGLAVSIDGRPAEVHIGIGTNGTYELLCPLALGENVFTVTARDFAGNQAEASVRVVREPAAGTERIEVVSGGGQEAPIARFLAEPVVVRRVAAAGAPVAGADLTFAVVRSDGLLSTAPDLGDAARAIRARTGADGTARVHWRLGTDAGCGNNRLEVSGEGVNLRTVVCASARPGPAAQINIGSGNNQRVEAGAPAAERLRAWVSDSCNGIAAVEVTFTVTRGSGRVNGASSVTVLTGPTGHAAVDFVLGSEAGNQVVEAQFEGNLTAPAVFTCFGVARREETPTSFEGWVLDNASQPIGGARCTLRLQDAVILETHSDLEGQFRFEDLPAAGLVDVFINGLVATTAGGVAVEPGSFPFLHYEPVLVPNAQNSLGAPVLLPRLDPGNARTYSTTEDTILEVEGMEGLRMTIRAGSMRLPVGPDRREGTPAPDGTIVALNQVHHDQVPMPMPDGAAPPFAWTLQPAGATFDPPIAIEYPNMSGLAPGAVANFLSFDHDTGRFEIVASGHVTEDGATIVTDPGVGLSLAGWGCNCPPYSVTGSCGRCPMTEGGGGGIPEEEECDPCKAAQDTMNEECARTAGSAAGALNCQLACLANTACNPENPEWVRCTIMDFSNRRFLGNTPPAEDFCRDIPTWVKAGPLNAGDLCFAFEGTAHLFGELMPSWRRKCNQIMDDEHAAFLSDTLVPCLNDNSHLSRIFRRVGALSVPIFAGITREIIQATCLHRGRGGGGGFGPLPPLPAWEQLYSTELAEASRLEVKAGEQFFIGAEEQVQLTVTRRNPDNSTEDLTAAASGTLYFAVAPYVPGFGPETVTVSPDGLLTVLATPSAFAPLPVQLLVVVRNGDDFGVGQFAIVDSDTDGDLLVDSYERRMGLDPLTPGFPDADADADGLTDLDESLLGTHPLLSDSDGDGLSDGFEVDQGSDPLDPDSFLPSFAPPAQRTAAEVECPGADELPVVSVGDQRVSADVDGSFTVANITAPDLFGAGGPGTPPDFLSDDPFRVLAVFRRACRTYYAWSERFRIRRGETAIPGELTISAEPPPLPERIAVTLPSATLEAGEAVQLTVTGTLGAFFGGAEVDVTTRERGTTYRTSHAGVATVDELGVLTTHGPGRAFITATNEGATTVRRVEVMSELVRVTVSGRLLLPGGSPAAGALISGPRGQNAMAGADGRFLLHLGLGPAEMAQVRMQLVVEGERLGAAVTLGPLADGAALDLGDITLEPGQGLLIEGFDLLGDNEQGHPEYCHLATGILFVLVPGGTFLMGSPDDEPGHLTHEGPVHEVELSPFLIAKHELTQEVWERVMGSNPSSFRGFPESPTHPVEMVSWNEAQDFCGQTGFKLPTEAQWEYAARAGTLTAFPNGPITQSLCAPLDPLLDAIGWYCANSESRSHPVGEKAPNGFGLHDMAGNVLEWCEDVFDEAFYARPEATMKDPLATAGSDRRVNRGGSWDYFARLCRSANRRGIRPTDREPILGLRPAFYPLP